MGKGRQQQLVRSLCCTSEVCAIPEEAKNRGNGDVLSRKMPSVAGVAVLVLVLFIN